MDEQELNRKLSKWAWFVEADIKKHYYWEVGGKRCAKWLEPNTTYHIKLPRFTQSLDACFKWLVPKLNKMGIRIHMITQPRGRNDYFCSMGGKWFPYQTVYAETPALALCLAIEKLIDKEMKG